MKSSRSWIRGGARSQRECFFYVPLRRDDIFKTFIRGWVSRNDHKTKDHFTRRHFFSVGAGRTCRHRTAMAHRKIYFCRAEDAAFKHHHHERGLLGAVQVVSPPPSSKWTAWTDWFAQAVQGALMRQTGQHARLLSYADTPCARQLLVWPRLARQHHFQLCAPLESRRHRAHAMVR